MIASTFYELTEAQVAKEKALEKAKVAFELLKDKITSTPLLRHAERSRKFSIIVHANNWAISAVIAQEHEGKLFPVRFTGRVLHAAELNYPIAEKEILALLRAFEVYMTMLVGQSLTVYTRYTSISWLFKSKSMKGRCHQWATMLSPWTLEVIQAKKDEDGLTSLLSASITPRWHLDEAVEGLEPLKSLKQVSPPISVEMLEASYSGWVLSFDGAAKLKAKVGSAGYVLWKLPEWSIVEARGDYLVDDEVTVNVAEYTGLMNGLKLVREHEVNELVVIGDSRLAIQQTQGFIGCHNPKLITILAQVHALMEEFSSVRLIHIKRTFNASADLITTRLLQQNASLTIRDPLELQILAKLNKLPESVVKSPLTKDFDNGNGANTLTSSEEVSRAASESSKVYAAQNRSHELPPKPAHDQLTDSSATDTRWKRIRQHQDAEPHLVSLKCYLRGQFDRLSPREVKELAKIAEKYVLDDAVLHERLGSETPTTVFELTETGNTS